MVSFKSENNRTKCSCLTTETRKENILVHWGPVCAMDHLNIYFFSHIHISWMLSLSLFLWMLLDTRLHAVTVLTGLYHEALVWFRWSCQAEIDAKYKSAAISISVIAPIPMTYKMRPVVKHSGMVHQVLSHRQWFDSNGLAIRGESISNVNPFWW